jgi:hypothetical protein
MRGISDRLGMPQNVEGLHRPCSLSLANLSPCHDIFMIAL